MGKISRKFKQLSLTVIVTIVVVLFYFESDNFLPRLEYLEQDLYYTLRGQLAPGDDVVIAAIDEKSIDKLGRWPWDRDVIARLVDSLSDYGAGVVGFDVVFSSPEVDAGLEYLLQADDLLKKRNNDSELSSIVEEGISHADHDQMLYESLDKAQNVVLGYFFHFSNLDLEHLSETQIEEYLEVIAYSRFAGIEKSSGTNLHLTPLRQAFAAEATIDRISQGAIQMGYFNFVPAVDGAIRKIPLIVKYRNMVELPDDNDYLFPPLSLNVLNEFLMSNVMVSIDQYGVNKIALAGEDVYTLPTNDMGEMWINYYGPRKTFKYISAVDIIEKNAAKKDIEGKMILVGATATAVEDLRITPYDKVYPGVEIHATVMDNVLSGRTISNPPIPKRIIDLLGIMAIGLLLFFLVPRLNAITIGGLFTVLITIIIAVSYYFFSKLFILVSAVPMLIEASVVTAALYIYRFIVEEKEKRYIQGAFSKYLSPTVISEIVKDPSKLNLGGVKREMTAFFSDVAGFSTISENMSPEDLVSLLNEYLTEMTDIVLKYDGTVDKYEGDAIIAFFGAPLDLPDHAKRCCLMALDMSRKIEDLNDKWAIEGRPKLEVRMGINTGQMVVGNMGSTTRMDYTIMGDAVNLAARLEGANKVFGTSIMISHSTFYACQNDVEVRELDLIRVVGKKEAIRVYELLSRAGELSEEKQKLVEHYYTGVKAYQQNKWDDGISIFGEIFKEHPTDGPSITYLERCLDYRIRPPEHGWDGVFTLSGK